jgi:hypothetical protein
VQRTGVGPGKAWVVRRRTSGEEGATRGTVLKAPRGADGLRKREPRDGARTVGRAPAPACAYGGVWRCRRGVAPGSRSGARERGRRRGVLNHLSVAFLIAINSNFRNRSALRDK